MRKQIFAALLFTAVLLTPSFAFGSKVEQQKATMTIVMIGAVRGRAGCSATAIAPHVILTAEHCNVENGVLYLNQNSKPYMNGLKVTEKYFDHNDHVLMVVPGVEFKHPIEYCVSKVRSAQQGERVYFWGNPALFMNQYREGYVSGAMHFPNKDMDDLDASGPFTLFVMPVVGGDSGSAVFSAADGQLVGIATWAIFDGAFLGSYPLRFTQEEIDQAEGLGNFVYVPGTTPEIVVTAAPPIVRVAPGGETTALTVLFAAFLVLFFVGSTLVSLAKAICKRAGRAAKYIGRFIKQGFYGAKR